MTSVLDDQLYKYLMSNAPVQDATPAPTAAPAPVAASPVSAQQPDDGAISINGFRPSKVPLLTKIGDMLTGNRFHMEDHIKQHDMQRALEGYDHDPRAAILRVMKIPGMATKAISMLNVVDDNLESEARGKMLEDALKDKRKSYIGSMMATTLDNGGKTYGAAVQSARKAWSNYGYTDDLDLPDKFDPDAVTRFIQGGITADQSIDNSRQAESLQHREMYQDQQLTLTKNRDANTKAYREARLSQMGQHYANMDAKTKQAKTPTYVNTKYGPGEVAPGGNLLRIQTGDVDHFYTKLANGQWRHVKQAPHDPKNGSLVDGNDNENDDDEDDLP